jgi:predicted DCC family thiol-disulfide oxidoreductase YuxK
MRATEVDDPAERERLWALADRVFPAFPVYRAEAAEAGRRISLVALTRRRAERAPVFVFDGECGFCTRWVAWLRRRVLADVAFVPSQEIDDLSALGLTAADVATASYWIDADGRPHRGSDSFAHALGTATLPWRVVGLVLRAPLVRPVAQRLYAVIARNRHRLPAPAER